MPPRKRIDADSRDRININCSKQQKVLLEKAAERSGADLSTLMVGYALRGIGALGAADRGEESAVMPVIVNDKVGAALRARAAEHGVPPDRMLELLLMAEG